MAGHPTRRCRGIPSRNSCRRILSSRRSSDRRCAQDHMMSTTIALSEAHLVYPPGEEIHTAASGLIQALHEYYLRIENGAGHVGIGEIRANIAFISHTPEDQVAPGIRALV